MDLQDIAARLDAVGWSSIVDQRTSAAAKIAAYLIRELDIWDRSQVVTDTDQRLSGAVKNIAKG